MVGHIAHVRWAAHGREMSSFVSAVRNKELYSDCLLCCKDGYQIPAHRAVLAMASPFFNVIFRSYPATDTTPCIVLEGVDRDQIDAILHYIYFGSLIVKCDRLPALSRTAKSLGIKEFPSLEIAPPTTFRKDREGSGTQDNSFTEEPPKRTTFNKALSGDSKENSSWSQSKKRKWADTQAVQIQTQDYTRKPRQIGTHFPQPSQHNHDRVPVLKQLLSPSYHIYSERSQKVPNDFMPADLPDRAARETTVVCPDKNTTAPYSQNKISNEKVKMEDSDELVEVCQLSDDDTSEQQQRLHQSKEYYGSTDSLNQRKKASPPKINAWECPKPQGPVPPWHQDSSLLQTELDRAKTSTTEKDFEENKTPSTKSSLAVIFSKSGSQSVSPRPVHSPLTPPANRPNSVPVIPSPNSVPNTGFPSSSQGPYDLSLKSSSSHVVSMLMPTHQQTAVHAEPLTRKQSIEGGNELKREKRVVTLDLPRWSTFNPKRWETQLREKTNAENIQSVNASGAKDNKYENNGISQSKSEEIKQGSLKCHKLSYLNDSTSAILHEEISPKVLHEETAISRNSSNNKKSHGNVTSTSTTNSTRPGPKTGPPALLSMVNGTNGWKVRKTSHNHEHAINEPNHNHKPYPQPYHQQRSSYIPLNSIGPRIQKFSTTSGNYGTLQSENKNTDPPEVSTSLMSPESSFRNNKERREYPKGESSEIKLEKDSSEQSPAGPALGNVPMADPLLMKISTTKRRRVRGPKSWEYLLRLLRDPSTNPSLIRWENEQEGIFRLVKPDAIALRWGKRTGKHCTDMLSYENFARGLRYHYVTGALSAVSERCFVYKFGPKAEKALKYSDCLAGGVTPNMMPDPPITEVV